MPHYAYLAEDLRCPSCHALVSDLVIFQWGYCPGFHIQQDYLYHLRDPIYWRRCADSSILSWVYFMEGDYPRGANIGDPAIKSLITRDTKQFTWQDPSERRRCDTCGDILEGAVIEIRDDMIQSARIYLPGEFDNGVDIVIIGPDGHLKPMPEWNDHPMSSVPEC